jgi:RNA polymerase sigma-70 factor (ECF subfamily)
MDELPSVQILLWVSRLLPAAFAGRRRIGIAVAMSRSPEEESAPRSSDHAALIERARSGNQDALQELLALHVDGLRAYVRLHADPMLRARESCSDMVQSVFRECLEDLASFSFQNEPAFRKWLFQKAMTKIVDRRRYWLAQRRHPGREQQQPVEHLNAWFPSASQIAIRNEDLESLEECFAQLPDEYRRVIVAARLIGQPHAEIAAELGKNEGAVRMLLHRALVRLALLMQERQGSAH